MSRFTSGPAVVVLSTRPAVHWFTYADLCRRGREAGFHRFYTKFDLLEPGDPSAKPAAPVVHESRALQTVAPKPRAPSIRRYDFMLKRRAAA